MACGIKCEGRRGLSRFPSFRTQGPPPNVDSNCSPLESFTKSQLRSLVQTVEADLDVAMAEKVSAVFLVPVTKKGSAMSRSLRPGGLIVEGPRGGSLFETAGPDGGCTQRARENDYVNPKGHGGVRRNKKDRKWNGDGSFLTL